jgi:hypothetical protein
MKRVAIAVSILALVAACAQPQGQTGAQEGGQTKPVVAKTIPPPNPLRDAYFGDLHVHTKLSFDAYIFNVRGDPDDAYNFAKGAPLDHAAGYKIRLNGPPLDFATVTDHSEYVGILPAMNDPNSPLSKIPYASDLFQTDQAKIQAAFGRVTAGLRSGVPAPEMYDKATMGSAWKVIQDAAARHYQPGKFTTFVAYEYTSSRDGRNLHRNVFFPTAKVPDMPFSAFDSQNPEKLWAWMDAQRAMGIESLAIPHNSNGSDGIMFERVTWDGKPIDRAWAEARARNEPLAEITQIKGTSETHPSLSPNDELANFEVMEWYVGSDTPVTKFAGGYVRDAVKRGIEFEANQGFNPYKYGFVGATDNHNASPGGSSEEKDYFSKVGRNDGMPVLRGSIPKEGRKTWTSADAPTGSGNRFQTWGASGLTGVWAEQNTREAIYAALRRKETFATSGPRMRVRLFGGWDLPADMATRADLVAQGYARGVPMGGDLLPAAGKTPKFLVWAVRDPNSGWLQRTQIVKGWVENGEAKEEVFDVSCSDGLTPDPRTNRCPDNGARVDLATCAIETKKGAVELKGMWTDPRFKPDQNAFYYARVVENPSCRWSTWEALRNGSPPSPRLQPTIQERAWTSPIWYDPKP